MGNKIFVSGSTGFVGQNLLNYLKDFQIRTIDRQLLNNISDAKLNDAQAIIHLAGKAHDMKSAFNPGEYYNINYELTKKLYDAFLLSNAKKFIFISSVKAAADEVEGVLTEQNVPNPVTDYGKSKLMAEEYLQNQSMPEGKSYYILRPCMIHGPGNKGNLNLLYNFVQKGLPYPLASFSNKRSFLSVENLCFVIDRLLEMEIPSGIYNVADDEALATTDVVMILAESLNMQPKLWALPRRLVRGLAKLGDLFRLPLNSEKLSKLTENYIVSNTKIKQAIGLNLPLSAREGLILTGSSFRVSNGKY